MSVNSTFDVDSIGGGMGGLGGLGGAGAFPLWLLIFLGLGRNGDNGLFGGGGGNNQGAGFVAGETQSKLDCLSQGQNSLAEQLRQQSDNFRFDGLNQNINNLAGIQRDATAAITAQNNDLSRQLADCCCDLKVGQQAIRTDIAMQTCDINANTNAGVQRIVDLVNANTVENKNDRIRELEQSAQTATLAAIVRDTCGSSHANSGGNSIDINVLARALQGQSQAA